jgi:Cof subfamily protein (haloacid dehalogenase superfamily)
MTSESPARAPAAAIELVALDIDGTVLTPEQGIASSTSSAIAQARERGVRLVLASSRGPAALEGIQAQLGLRGEWFVGYQGALVARWVGGKLEVLANTPLDVELANVIEDRAVAAGLSVGRYIGCRWRVPRMTEAIEREACITGDRPMLSGADDSDGDAAPHKVLVISGDDRGLEALRALAKSLPGEVTATFSHMNYLEITATGVDKAHGLRPVVAHLGIPRHRTAAIGDGLNDLALFAAVAYPIAMGQAVAQVQAAAQWVTGSNTDEGVARALAHLGLATWATRSQLPERPGRHARPLG